jgi:NAD(P)-dependent dehydrogenase (short-subunit alcohol dehydrogenase family)
MGLATESARAKSLRRFDGQVAIVTGAAQGIGWAIAQRLGSEGAAVLLADLNGEGVHRRAEELEAGGTKAAARQVDVGLVADVEGMVGDAVGRWGRLDMLVNNAFPAMKAVTGGAEDVLPEDYDKAMAVLVKASYLGARFGVPHMRHVGGGSIVNISSVHGLLAARGALVYETGKAALIAATRQMAVEYGKDGIRANSIAPGHIATEVIEQDLWDKNPSGRAFFAAQYPVGRVGAPDDIAAAVAFLCSEDAAFITGHTLVVDGGLSVQLQENFGVDQAQYIKARPDTELPY